jgi:RHS repeat-associated protein
VSYLHAGGIDRPLSIWKEGVGSVRPHQNWRGQFARGTWGAGPLQGRSSDCAYAGAPDCIPLPWPGYRTNAWHQESRAGDPEYWMGSLVDGMRDVTGQIYMRNRYYDAATGQFTQPDPIGIAGGLNSYGFAAGDPVTYSDPYGLEVCYNGTAQDRADLVRATEQATNTTITLDRSGRCIVVATPNTNGQNSRFRSLQRRFNKVVGDPDVHEVAFGSCPDGDAGCFNFLTNSITISRSDPTGFYPARGRGGWGCRYSQRDQPLSREATLVHELLGHAEAPGLRQIYEPRARDVQNEYHRAVGETLRCRHG